MHPLTGRSIPIYAADYVISGCGIKAVMGVPGHDDKDLLFAQEHDLPITTVNHLRENGEGALCNSDKVPSYAITCVALPHLGYLIAVLGTFNQRRWRSHSKVFIFSWSWWSHDTIQTT